MARASKLIETLIEFAVTDGFQVLGALKAFAGLDGEPVPQLGVHDFI